MNDFILNLFTGTDEERPLMMFPNLTEGNVIATDAHSLISIPENELSFKYSSNEKFPNGNKILTEFFDAKLESIKVNVCDLAKELAKARIVIDEDSIKCTECNGSGSVEFEYEDSSRKTHCIDGECPICEGEGSFNHDSKFARLRLEMIETEDGNRTGILINDLYFHPFQLYRIFLVASIKMVDEFEILFNPNKYGSVVVVFGNIKVLTMLMKKD